MRAQAAVIHRRQALGCGLTGAQVDARVAGGCWELLHPDVFVAAGAPVTFHTRCWGAWLAVRFGTQSAARERRVLVAGLAAAYLHEMVGCREPDGVELAVPLDADVPDLRGVRLVRVARWRELQRSKHRGLPLTGRVDTVMRVAALRSDAAVLALAQDEMFHRRLSPEDLLSRCRRGKPGSARARRVAGALAAGLDSGLHRDGVALLADCGLPAPTCGVEVVPGFGETDCVIARLGATGRPFGMVVEWDGAHHWLSRAKYRHGLRKRRAIQRAGYPVFRYTDDDVRDPRELRAELLAEYRRQLALPPEGDGSPF